MSMDSIIHRRRRILLRVAPPTPPPAATITVNVQPSPDTVDAPDAASFTVDASAEDGDTNPVTVSYQWQEDDGTGFANIPNGGIYSGAKTDTLAISATTLAMDGYEYRCVLTAPGAARVKTDAVALTVNEP